MNCSSGCKFCFEKYTKKTFPNIIIRDEGPRYQCKSGKIYHSKYVDFFDRAIDVRETDNLYDYAARGFLYTTGNNLSNEDAAYLSSDVRNPPLWFSVVTLDNDLREELFSHTRRSEEIIELLKILEKPFVSLFCLNYEQIIEDIELINSVNNSCTIAISLMEYNKDYPEFLIRHSEQGKIDLKEVVDFLYKRNYQLIFYAPSEAYVWCHRNAIKDLLEQYEITDKDLILCSKAAYNEIRGFYKNVKCIPNLFGGSIDFSTVLTSEDVESCIEPDKERIFVPSSIWWIDNKYDLKGNSVDAFKEKFRNVEVVEISEEILDYRLTLEDCYLFFNREV